LCFTQRIAWLWPTEKAETCSSYHIQCYARLDKSGILLEILRTYDKGGMTFVITNVTRNKSLKFTLVSLYKWFDHYSPAQAQFSQVISFLYNLQSRFCVSHLFLPPYTSHAVHPTWHVLFNNIKWHVNIATPLNALGFPPYVHRVTTIPPNPHDLKRNTTLNKSQFLNYLFRAISINYSFIEPYLHCFALINESTVH
jgi:hypothetical protein